MWDFDNLIKLYGTERGHLNKQTGFRGNKCSAKSLILVNGLSFSLHR